MIAFTIQQLELSSLEVSWEITQQQNRVIKAVRDTLHISTLGRKWSQLSMRMVMK